MSNIILRFVYIFFYSSDQSGWNVMTGTEMEGKKVKSHDFLSPDIKFISNRYSTSAHWI